MGQRYFINSVYIATEGEGIQLGKVQIFVRFQGCQIHCVNCDSMETWSFENAQEMSADSLWDMIISLSEKNKTSPIKRVSITGGDPLHPRHEEAVKELCLRLKKNGFYVNIEASGLRIVDSIFSVVDFVSFDFKTPSTGHKTSPDFVLNMAQTYPGKFQVKSVVVDDQDFDAVLKAYQIVKAAHLPDFDWCLTPVFCPGEEFPQARFVKVLKLNEEQGGIFRVIGQQHKWVYGPDKTLV